MTQKIGGLACDPVPLAISRETMKPRSRLYTALGLAAMLAMTVLGGCGGGSNGPTFTGILTHSSGGVMPQGIGVDANGNVWIANEGSNDVVELNSAGAEVAKFPVGLQPHGLRINRATGVPTSGQVWVENTGSSNVTVIDTVAGKVLATYPTGKPGQNTQPQHAQFDAAGNCWITNQGTGEVVALTPSGAPLFAAPIDVGGNPHAIAKDQSGNFWVANYSLGTVTKIDSSGNIIGNFLNVALSLTGNAIDLVGNLWQSIAAADRVAEVDGSTGATLGTFPVGAVPRGVTIDRAGKGNVFVANQDSNDVVELDPTGKTTLRTFPVGSRPENMAIDEQGNVWVTNAGSDTVSELIGAAPPDLTDDDASNG